jgi:mRNA-degrading endonuclease RelE of RelBE toxin-antitoxin system
MEIIEAPVFTKDIVRMLSDDAYKKLQGVLIEQPLTGDLIAGGAGLRKLRWSIAGKGKRSGLRIIYYYLTKDDVIFLISVYKKSQKESLAPEHLKKLVNWVKEYL